MNDTKNSKKGKIILYQWGNKELSITNLLNYPEISSFINREKKYTYASQREKLRKLLKDKKISPEIVNEYFKNNSVTFNLNNEQYKLYGAQRRRQNLPLKNKKGEILFGPQPAPKIKKSRGIKINGINLTAKKTLEKYPELRGFLQPKKRLKENSLISKLRNYFKKGKIPDYIFNEKPPEFVLYQTALDETIKKYECEDERLYNYDIITIFNYLKNQILELIQNHPNTKISLDVHVKMFQPSKGNEENKGLKSGVKRIFKK